MAKTTARRMRTSVDTSRRIAPHLITRHRADRPGGSGRSGEAGALQVLENAAPLDGLCKDNVGPRLVGACKVGFPISGHDHHARAAIAGVGEDLPNQDIARNVGQSEIAEDDVEVAPASNLSGFPAGARGSDVGTLRTEQYREHLTDVRRIFNKQDSHTV